MGTHAHLRPEVIQSLDSSALSTEHTKATCRLLKVPILTLMRTLYMTTIRYVLEVWCSLGSLCSFPSSCWQATRLPTVANPSQEDLLKMTEVCRTNEEPREGLPSPHC